MEFQTKPIRTSEIGYLSVGHYTSLIVEIRQWENKIRINFKFNCAILTGITVWKLKIEIQSGHHIGNTNPKCNTQMQIKAAQRRTRSECEIKCEIEL